ncbi:MAG: hypothetical protein ABH856_00125 [Patescibacteria group bacterium]
MIEVRAEQPRMGLVAIRCENSPYVSYSGNMKNCYLCSGSEYDEDCYYSFFLYNSKDCFGCDYCRECTLCYDCVDCLGCYNSNFSQDCQNCTDCEYLYDCIGCQNCFGCVGQRRQNKMIFNKKVDDYEKKVKKMKEKMTQDEIKGKVEKLQFEVPRMYVHQMKNQNFTGDYMKNCKNSFHCFDTTDLEDCMYCNNSEQLKDCLDMSNSYYKSELCYDVMSEMELYNCDFCVTCFYSNDLMYCENVHNSNNCFGCFSMNHAEYCIFNEKYSKEEYFKKKAEIVEQMKKTKEFGEHLPSTYAYEDSNAAMHWPE